MRDLGIMCVRGRGRKRGREGRRDIERVGAKCSVGEEEKSCRALSKEKRHDRSPLVNASRAFSGEGMLFSTGRGSTTHLKPGRVASATSSPHSSSSHSPLAQPLLVTSINQR